MWDHHPGSATAASRRAPVGAGRRDDDDNGDDDPTHVDVDRARAGHVHARGADSNAPTVGGVADDLAPHGSPGHAHAHVVARADVGAPNRAGTGSGPGSGSGTAACTCTRAVPCAVAGGVY